MNPEYDFTQGERGKFFRPGAVVRVSPVSQDAAPGSNRPGNHAAKVEKCRPSGAVTTTESCGQVVRKPKLRKYLLVGYAHNPE